MFDTIVVATDGSQHGERAFALAQSMARGGSSRLFVVHVTEIVGGKGGMFPVAADEDEIRRSLADAVDKLQADGVAAELILQPIRLGGPAHVIAEIAESVQADLIVVGSRGHSLLGEVLLGGVPVRLLQLARRPVLVVPPVTAP
jgi:nucleotide-binding universal stress UspA family protein